VSSEENSDGSSATSWLNSAVVTNAVSTPCARRASRSRRASKATSLDIPATTPPLSSGPQISNVAASNDAFASWATTEWGPSFT
jgi:hypothetical protein